MNAVNAVAAEILEASAPGYAAAANAILRASRGSAANASDSAWKAHFAQRILELAAAVRAADPALFARRITWLRRAVLARGADERDLRHGLLSLRDALETELPEHLRAVVLPALDLALGALEGTITPDAERLDPTKPSDQLALEYLAACLEGDPQRGIWLVLDAVERGLPPATVYGEVLIAAQKEIGQMWHMGEASIAEERLVTETTRDLLAIVANRYAPPSPGNRLVIAAAVAGNAHDIGLRAAAELFRLEGWRCVYLGANVPADEIAHAAEVYEAQLVLLNATLSTQLKSLAESIEVIRANAPGRPILVGGLALNDSPRLLRQLGADAFAPTVASAVTLGNKLVPTPK